MAPNFGWYGSRPLTPAECYSSSADAGPLADDSRAVDPTPSDPSGEPMFVRFGPMAMLRETIASREPRAEIEKNSERPRYRLVLRYRGNSVALERCASRIVKLVEADSARQKASRVAWTIINEETAVLTADLAALIPDDLRLITTIQSDGGEHGAAGIMNSSDWSILLSADGSGSDNMLEVLDHYICSFRNCRCIVTGTIDVDESGQELARHRPDRDPSFAGESGIMGGHLLAIRNDLIAELEPAMPAARAEPNAQTLLQIAVREPVLSIPDYIYLHLKSPAPAPVTDQDSRAFNRLRKSILSQLVGNCWPDTGMAAPRPRVPKIYQRGICLIRTQGNRADLLAEAVHSVTEQTIPIVPCIIVHGDKATFDILLQWASELNTPVILLHADHPGKLRGYPFNVGLDYIREHAGEFDFMCILDDDDIYYPFFATRMSQALTLSNADIVFALANCREPGSAPRPGWQSRPVACLVCANFIPTNTFVIKTSALVSSGVQFREDMNYLEDWDFLLSLLVAGSYFHCVQEVLSEFRIISDGNRTEKTDISHFNHCLDRVMARGRLAARMLGWSYFYRSLMTYEADRSEPQDPNILNDLIRAQRIFKTEHPTQP